LWVNFTVQVFLAIGLGYGKAREGLMSDAPRSPEQRILPSRLFAYLVIVGVVMAGVTLGVIWWATDAYGEAVARTMGLATFSLTNIWFALETADEDRSLFSGGIFENPTLLKAAGLALIATIAATELGILNRILDTVPMNIDQWLICLVVSLSVIVVAEAKKLLHIQTSDPPVRVEPAPSAAPA
jgi:Ca2+-transporting ATPase